MSQERPREERNDPLEQTSGDRILDAFMNGGEQFGIMNIPGGTNKLLYTPVTIEGVDALALVDSGASTMFIADRFVKEHGIELNEVKGTITGGTGLKLAERIGTVSVTVENGGRNVQRTPEVILLPQGHDLAIGLPHFKNFGYSLAGVPAKKPTNDEEPIVADGDLEDYVDGLTAADMSPRVDQALKRNQEIPLSSRCSHPLAVLRLKPKPTTPIWRRLNYVSNSDKEKETSKEQEWLEADATAVAPQTCTKNVPFRAVPK